LEDPLSENLLRGAFKGMSKLRCVLREVDGEKKLAFESADVVEPKEPELAAAGAAGEST
jgi:hypothetical protein